MAQCRFIFWNLRRNPAAAELLAAGSGADVVIACEVPDELHGAMARSGYARALHHLPTGRVELYSRGHFIGSPVDHKGPEHTWFPIEVGGVELSCVCVHLPSKLTSDAPSQTLDLLRLAERIDREERERFGHRRTLLVGDFNADPFDDGVVAHSGLNAMACAHTASHGAGVRVHGGEERPTFYNPMWSHLGDRTPGPPGSHFYSGGGSVRTFWHLYDQVLVRPALATALTDVRVVTSLGDTALATASPALRPLARYSDHHPIAFTLDTARVV